MTKKLSSSCEHMAFSFFSFRLDISPKSFLQEMATEHSSGETPSEGPPEQGKDNICISIAYNKIL